MVFFTLFLLFVFPFLQAGPLDNWVSFLTWMSSLSSRSSSAFFSASQSRTKTTTTARKIEPECSSERRCLR